MVRPGNGWVLRMPRGAFGGLVVSGWWGLAPSPHPEQHRGEPQDHQQECVKKQVVHHLSFPKIGETEIYYLVFRRGNYPQDRGYTTI